MVIYNSIDIVKITTLLNNEVEHTCFNENIPLITVCGRLTSSKNYPLLLKSFAIIQREIKARLLILGEGEKRKSLEDLVDKLGIQDKVMFLGFQKNPFKYIAKSNIFVLSSSWEGFSIVIVEAMACGVPVISTRCPSGPDEIITDEVNGLLVPVANVDAMAQAILRLLKDESLSNRLAEAGKKRAKDFKVEKMVAEYERLFEVVCRL